MRRHFLFIIFALLSSEALFAQTNEVLLETTEGNIRIMLYDDTPLHRDNFLKLVGEQFYDSLLFWLDTLGRTDSTDYVLMGTLPADDELPHNAYFGIYNRYTVSRAKNFFFDDIGEEEAWRTSQPAALAGKGKARAGEGRGTSAFCAGFA